MRELQRIAILGGAGAGKSTLARTIGEALSLPVIHLDRIVFGPHWSRVEMDVARARLADAVAGGRWVTDGTYPQLSDLILPAADLVLWIEQPMLKRLWRAWRKTRFHKNAPRADRPDDSEEAFTWHYAWQVMRFGRFMRGVRRRLRAATTAEVRCLRGDRAVAKFIHNLK